LRIGRKSVEAARDGGDAEEVREWQEGKDAEEKLVG